MSDTVPIPVENFRRGKNTIKRIKTKIKKNLVRKTVVATWATVSVVTIVILVKKNKAVTEDFDSLTKNYHELSSSFNNLTEGYQTLSERLIEQYYEINASIPVMS